MARILPVYRVAPVSLGSYQKLTTHTSHWAGPIKDDNLREKVNGAKVCGALGLVSTSYPRSVAPVVMPLRARYPGTRLTEKLLDATSSER